MDAVRRCDAQVGGASAYEIPEDATAGTAGTTGLTPFHAIVVAAGHRDKPAQVCTTGAAELRRQVNIAKHESQLERWGCSCGAVGVISSGV
jgi:hypothetical protein